MKLDAAASVPQNYSRNTTERKPVDTDQASSFDEALKADTDQEQNTETAASVEDNEFNDKQPEAVKEDKVENGDLSEEETASLKVSDKSDAEIIELAADDAELVNITEEEAEPSVVVEEEAIAKVETAKVTVLETKVVDHQQTQKSASIHEEILNADIQKKSKSGIPVDPDAIPDRKALEKLLNTEELNGKANEVQKDSSKINVERVALKENTTTNLRTEQKSVQNATNAGTQLASDQGSSAKIVNSVVEKQTRVSVDPQRAAIIKDQIVVGGDKEIRIGEVRFERVPPSGVNQIIIQTVANEGRVSPVITNSLMPENLPTQMNKTLTIQLHPENLGTVEVKIRSVNGQLNVAIETTTQAAEKLLKTEMATLADRLSASGITSDELTVRVNPNLELTRDNNNQERQNNWNQNQSAEGELARNREHAEKQEFMEQDEAGNVSLPADEQGRQTFGNSQGDSQREGIYI